MVRHWEPEHLNNLKLDCNGMMFKLPVISLVVWKRVGDNTKSSECESKFSNVKYLQSTKAREFGTLDPPKCEWYGFDMLKVTRTLEWTVVMTLACPIDW